MIYVYCSSNPTVRSFVTEYTPLLSVISSNPSVLNVPFTPTLLTSLWKLKLGLLESNIKVYGAVLIPLAIVNVVVCSIELPEAVNIFNEIDKTR